MDERKRLNICELSAIIPIHIYVCVTIVDTYSIVSIWLMYDKNDDESKYGVVSSYLLNR